MISFGSLSAYDRLDDTAARTIASNILMIDGHHWSLDSEGSLYPRLIPENKQTATPDTLSAKKLALQGRTSESSLSAKKLPLQGRTSESSLYPKFTEKQESGSFSQDLSPKKNQPKAQSDCIEEVGNNDVIVEYARRRRPPPQNMRVAKSPSLSDREREDLENWQVRGVFLSPQEHTPPSMSSLYPKLTEIQPELGAFKNTKVLKNDEWSDEREDLGNWNGPRNVLNFTHQESVSPLCSDDESESCTEERTMMEVAPGLKLVLRSSSETKKAIRKGNTKQTFCLDCSSSLRVISDAEYVLCPMCHSLTPMSITLSLEEMAGAFGIGLGFQLERELRPQRSSAPVNFGYGRAA